MSAWFALAVLVAAIGLTYLCCVRPMRRGHDGQAGQTGEADRRVEIDRLRAEIAQARRELHDTRPE